MSEGWVVCGRGRGQCSSGLSKCLLEFTVGGSMLLSKC